MDKKIDNTDEARQYLLTFMREHFIDKTFGEYILTRLAGDFAWNLATALAERASNPASPALPDHAPSILRDMLVIQEACGLHTDEYAPGSVIEYIKELEDDAASPAPVAASDEPGAHHLTPENVEAIAADLEAVARGEATVPAAHRDWITGSAILAKVIRHLAALSTAPQAQAAQQPGLEIALAVNKKLGEYIAANKQALSLLSAEELAALRRFNETCEDDEEYDVPKEMMRRLAAIGAIEWKGFSRYQFTDFGMLVLGSAAPAAPDEG